MPYTSAKADCVLDLSPDTVRALVMYLTRDWSLERLEELIESSRLDDAAAVLEEDVE